MDLDAAMWKAKVEPTPANLGEFYRQLIDLELLVAVDPLPEAGVTVSSIEGHRKLLRFGDGHGRSAVFAFTNPSAANAWRRDANTTPIPAQTLFHSLLDVEVDAVIINGNGSDAVVGREVFGILALGINPTTSAKADPVVIPAGTTTLHRCPSSPIAVQLAMMPRTAIKGMYGIKMAFLTEVLDSQTKKISYSLSLSFDGNVAANAKGPMMDGLGSIAFELLPTDEFLSISEMSPMVQQQMKKDFEPLINR